jgi:hypothetical protein
MGRVAEGFSLRPPNDKSPFYAVRFTVPATEHAPSRRVDRSTGEGEPQGAAREARRIFNEENSGGARARVVARNDRDLATDVAEWLKWYGRTHAKNRRSETNARSRAATFIEHFASYDAITRDAVRAWGVTRLGQVTRKYHRQERSTLHVFLEWAHAKGYAPEPFDFAPLPKGSNGVRVTTQKRDATILAPDKIEALLSAMPERSHGGGGNKAILIRHRGVELPLSAWARVYGMSETTLYYQIVKKGLKLAKAVEGRAIAVEPTELASRGLWVRPFFEVLWETGLRPITVMRIEAGVHYVKGTRTLKVTAEIDKVDFARTLPLTNRAIAALDRAYPKSGGGAIFGMHDYDAQLERAKRIARTPTAFTSYDTRHSRLTDLVGTTGDVMGAGYLAGHRDVATTSIYLHGQEKDAARMLAAYAAARQARSTDCGGIVGEPAANEKRRRAAK